MFDDPAAFAGQVSFSGPNRSPAQAGGAVNLSGEGFIPGQAILLSRGGEGSRPRGLVAGAEGKFAFALTLPVGGVIGQRPVVVETMRLTAPPWQI